MVQNGYNDKEALTLQNKYTPYQNPYLLPIDERLYSDKENYGTNVFAEDNLLYKANEDLLNEIEQKK